MTMRFWADAVELVGAARREARPRAVLHMMGTDAYFLLFLFRARRLVRRLHVPCANRILRLMQMMFGGVEIGNDVTLGHGVYFVHSLGTVIGGTARVGNRVRLLGNNTVGTARDNGYPTIEDDVELGAGARVLGPVRIGARAIIGANAVVLTDIPSDAVAVGAPARVIRRHGVSL
jgi:serine O-acetyltransferase